MNDVKGAVNLAVYYGVRGAVGDSVYSEVGREVWLAVHDSLKELE